MTRNSRSPHRFARLLALLAAGALIFALVGADGGCGSTPTTKSSADSAANSTEESMATETVAQETATEEAPPPEPEEAKVGDAITLAGQSDGESIRVKLVEVLDPLPIGEYDSPESGKRYVGMVIRMTNTGSVAYSDSPGNGAVVTYGDDRQASSDSVSEGPCGDSFDADLKLAVGESAKGCIPFQVKASSTLKRFKFTLSSGFADETGIWSLR